jgi:DNA (cytosine-5)-methyltransferase 1
MSLTYTDIFCGAGGSSIGLTEAGFELKLAANHWARAIETHSANFRDAEHLLADVSNYDMRRLPSTDILWASPICFPGGTTVLTMAGPAAIEDVQVGDYVLTHRGRWMPVYKTMRSVSDTVIVKGYGHNELETTAEHPFFARRVERQWDNGRRGYRKELGAREWVEAKNLDSHMWATPRSFGSRTPVPPAGGRGIVFTEAFWWMVGRWVGDGYVRIQEGEAEPLPKVGRHRSQPPGSACTMCPQLARPDQRSSAGRVSPYCSDACKSKSKRAKPTVRRHDLYICCGDHEADGLGERLAAVASPSGSRARAGELRWRRTHPAAVTVFEASHTGLTNWLVEHFGRHAHGKRLPAWALTMPEEWRRALLDGYLSADGNVNNTSTRFSTVSRPLAVGMRLLAVSLGHQASLYAPARRTSGVIEGRAVTMRPSWSAGWTTAPDASHGSRTREDDLHLWSPVRSVREGRSQVEVFNVAVVGDESYVADGIVVHNCTENSPAGGRKRRPKGQMDLFEENGHVPGAGFERTRATFHDVIRAAEVHRYKAVIVENVVEAADWELWDWWLNGMVLLGYNYQLVSVSSAHVGGEDNPYAPQWRDRLYIVFTRTGIPLPDVDPKPLAWCPVCEKAVAAFQSWKRPERPKIGKYGRQYVYRCPRLECRHAVAEPFVLPAAAAIDWSDLGTKIGDRKRPLAANTIRRIRAGLEMFSQPVAVAVGGNTYERPGSGYVRAWPVNDAPMGTRNCTREQALATPPFLTLIRSDRIRNIGVDEPMASIAAQGAHHALVLPLGGYNRTADPTTAGEPFRTRVVRDTDALVTQPFITMLRNNTAPTSTDEPMASVLVAAGPGGGHHALTVPPFITQLRGGMDAAGTDEPLASVMARSHDALTTPPFIVKNNGDYCTPEQNAEPVTNPLSSVVVRDHHALVVPYRGKRGHATTTGVPLHTLATRDSAALVQPDDLADVAECRLRMLKPREHLRAQRFPDSYIVTGNQGEQTCQAGNAVSSNVAHWLGRAVAAVL